MAYRTLFAILLLLPLLGTAQQLTPSVVGSAGGYFTSVSAGDLHFTVGEIAIETTTNGPILERGFLHGVRADAATGIWSVPRLALDLSVYPNPTADHITVAGSWEADDRVAVYDLVGRRLVERALPADRVELDLLAYPAGTYFLTVSRAGRVVGRARVVRQ